MHVEAMNFSGMGHAEHAATLVSHRVHRAFDAIAWNNWRRNGCVPCFIGAPGPILAALLIARAVSIARHRRERTGGRTVSASPQKRAPQKKEKPRVAPGGGLASHGIATGQLFRWRVQFALTTRKTPQRATVILADGAMNQVPALGTSPDLVRPRDGMSVYIMEIRASGVMEPRHHHAPQHSIGRLQRAMARNLAI
jgi:hypothetical protein